MKRVHIALVALLVMGLTAVQALSTEQYSGSVETLRNGSLDRQQTESWIAMTVGDQVFLRDRLRTDSKALAILGLPQVGRYVMGPNSQIEIGERVKDFTTTLVKGGVWVDADLADGNTLTVKTVLASTGVRGTKFSVIHDEDGMDVCTCEGVVDLTLADGSVLTVPAGSFAPLDNNGASVGGVRSSSQILRRVGEGKNPRYDWCFTCHQVGGAMKKDW